MRPEGTAPTDFPISRPPVCEVNGRETGKVKLEVVAHSARATLERAVHCNTLEGLWTGLRKFLRTVRGVHKKHLY